MISPTYQHVAKLADAVESFATELSQLRGELRHRASVLENKCEELEKRLPESTQLTMDELKSMHPRDILKLKGENMTRAWVACFEERILHLHDHLDRHYGWFENDYNRLRNIEKHLANISERLSKLEGEKTIEEQE